MQRCLLHDADKLPDLSAAWQGIPASAHSRLAQRSDKPIAGRREALNSSAGMSLKPTEKLRKLYSGLDRDREAVVYCQSGVRASVTATVLRDLGFMDVKLYEPSWLGCAGTLSAPAEKEVYFNVAALNGRLAALQGRVGELEAELVRVKAAR